MSNLFETRISELGDEVITMTGADGLKWTIPTDANNSDYQRYLRWLENPDADETTPTIEVTND